MHRIYIVLLTLFCGCASQDTIDSVDQRTLEVVDRQSISRFHVVEYQNKCGLTKREYANQYGRQLICIEKNLNLTVETALAIYDDINSSFCAGPLRIFKNHEGELAILGGCPETGRNIGCSATIEKIGDHWKIKEYGACLE